VNRKLPHLGDAGRGRSAYIYEWFAALMDRTRGVRVAVGDWQRVLTDSVTVRHGLTGVFLDPPYTKGAMDYAAGGVGREFGHGQIVSVEKTAAKDAKTAVSDTCPDCGGTGSVPSGGGPSEGEVDEGYVKCSTCGGTGKVSPDTTASVKTAADTKATPAEGTIKDVGNGSLAEKATCAKCGKSITKGVAQRTTGWVHQSGSKWCPSGATVAYREASLQTTASWVDAARSVVTNKQAQTVDGILLDLFSASTMLGVYDALNPDNKAKFEAMPLAQAQSMAFRLVEKTSAARVAEGDAAPFVGEAAGEGVREAFTRNDYGFPQDAAPRPPKPSSPTAGDMPGSVTYTSDPAQRPDYYGLGVPADQRKDRTPKDTAPVDGTRTARDKRADELARMTERSNELAERHRQERDDDRESRERHRQYWDQHPDEYDSYLKDNPYVASLVDGVVQVLAEANSYSTSGNPYIPAQVPPGTPDDILDGPVNPAPQMLDVPMTTRPRQMPSGDSTLPPAEPGAGSKETL
jgi:hypothetical protein